MQEKTAIIIGGGLAGSEAALQLAKRGIRVILYEMRPKKMTGAHRSGMLAELVCSNSFRSIELSRAAGLLKAELNILDSELLKISLRTRVPAGVSLSVDREAFSSEVTKLLEENPLIEIRREEVTEIPDQRPLIVASGPLTSKPLLESLKKILGDDSFLHFFDAVAPLIYAETIDLSKAFIQDRYGKGEGSYINCPMTKEEFENFYREILNAEKHPLKIEGEERYFEACLPIEEMAKRGEKTLLFGPLKPVGIVEPRTGKRPYAVVQLRQDDVAKQLYNMVGFQTNLTYKEQKRIFRMIPGLQNAEFARYGKMHLNTYIESNKLLTPYLSLKNDPSIFFAGQITGSEGYVEAIATGLVAAINAYRLLVSKKPVVLPETTALGSLIRYLTSEERKEKLEPMHASFGLLPPLEKKLPRKIRYFAYTERAIKDLLNFTSNLL
ncbi:MAG: methylenetetrahydrofolate--tRNA-(uracil(54)-C(5))-methyltransferase (FADH(2)-oxidizing) TrmFO [Actinobacteria bacterium]|nr:methylenetetrahydrofolate--tRNA-(uracil(54)-C(5))-methyltransferase (FADH(2)-oxidizing) TrmFO [Actinomycetota bacterium]